MNIILPINPALNSSLRRVTYSLLALSAIILLLSSCGNTMGEYSSVTSYTAESGTLNRNSASSAHRVIIKTASLSLKTANVRKASESLEQIIIEAGGHMTSMEERDDKTKNAEFNILVPATKLVATMDRISQLGTVHFRKTSVTDATKEAIQQQAKLKQLKARRDRLKALYRQSKTLADKLKAESILATIEQEIFNMEEAIKQLNKTSSFSQLSVSLSLKKIRGPIGIVKDSSIWSVKKLFTIRE